MPCKKYSKDLGPIHKRLGPELTLAAWVKYLNNTDAQYASASRFAATIGQWSGTGKGIVQDWNSKKDPLLGGE